MAGLLVEVERGLLSDAERRSPRWFPRWFTYTMSEAEKRSWSAYEAQNPLNLDFTNLETKKTPRAQNNNSTRPSSNETASNGMGTTKSASTTLDQSATRNVEEPDTVMTAFEENLDLKATIESTDGLEFSSSSNIKITSNVPASPQDPLVHPEDESVGQSEAPKETGPCRVCQEITEQRCTGCMKVFYCSREHQKADWKAAHKRECKGKAKAS